MSSRQTSPTPFVLFALMAFPVSSFSPPNPLKGPRKHVQCADSHVMESCWNLPYRNFVLQAATASSVNEVSLDDSSNSDATDNNLDMPWTDFQEWALRDNLPLYLVSIPKSGKQELFALWRTMTREVTELSGYPIDFLQDMHTRQLKGVDTGKSAVAITPGILPFLDEFEFATGGGVSGKAYGIPGIADGTKIETSGIKDVTATVPKGFVRTADGSSAYELGVPMRESFLTLDGESGIAAVRGAGDAVAKTATGALVSASGGSTSMGSILENPDGSLIRLAALSSTLLAGASAVGMLSHHLTVNVFWV